MFFFKLQRKRPVGLRVGPEGRPVFPTRPPAFDAGLDDDEKRLVEGRGWQRLCLGRHTLRAETAAVIGAALLDLAAGPEGGRAVPG